MATTTRSTDSQRTLAYRAADYFGMAREPRTSIPMGDGKCIVVTKRDGRLIVAVYEEFASGTRKGIYLNFTDARYEKLYEAIDHFVKA